MCICYCTGWLATLFADKNSSTFPRTFKEPRNFSSKPTPLNVQHRRQASRVQEALRRWKSNLIRTADDGVKVQSQLFHNVVLYVQVKFVTNDTHTRMFRYDRLTVKTTGHGLTKEILGFSTAKKKPIQILLWMTGHPGYIQ